MEENFHDKIKFERRLIVIGTSKTFTLPVEVRNFLGLSLGDSVIITCDINKKGQKFGAFWKSEE